MIQVNVQRKLDQMIQDIIIHGHAESGEYGNDMICCAVSAISVGMLNAMDELICDKEAYEDICEDGHVEIHVKKDDVILQILLEGMLGQLKSVAFIHPTYIKIVNQEV